MNEKIKAYYVADDINEVLNYIDNLEQENARLKDKKEKAIKYIEDNRDTCYMDEDITYILNTLKYDGDDNE